MKRIKAVIFLLAVTICTTLGYSYPVNANGYDCTQMDLSEINYIHMNNPVQMLNVNGVSVVYTYSTQNVLASKTIGDCQTIYTVNNGLITGEVCDDNVSQYEYELYGDEMRCCSIIINGERYELDYDYVGNVSGIYKNNELVCEYDYSGSQCSVHSVGDTNTALESDFSFVGNINPFRYQGWYFDKDVNFYYLGDGVFYDPSEECFVQNDFSLELGNMVGLRSLTQPEQSSIIGLYTSAMNAPGYGGDKLLKCYGV